MKQVCLHCLREGALGSVWCQESNCSIDDKPMVLEYGESLGDIRVIRLVNLLRTSAVYEAKRGEEEVLLKVAHDSHQERLKRESHFLMQLQDRKIRHVALPKLLPAHGQADLKTYPYGKSVVNEQTKYFAVFEYAGGESLHEYLLRDPQPWYQYAGWIVLGLADVVAFMHQVERLHLCLSPYDILIRTDKDQIPRPLLLDLGAVTSPQNAGQSWQRDYLPPAYVAPELLGIEGGRVGAFTDVYGLGLILYEMLAGQPVYNYRLRSDNEVYYNVLNRSPAPLNRPDLKGFPQIAERAISKDFRRRQPSIITLANELQASLPKVPKEKKQRQVNWRTVGIIITALLAIAMLLVLAMSFNQASQAISG